MLYRIHVPEARPHDGTILRGDCPNSNQVLTKRGIVNASRSYGSI
jgi:hypothetical protein